MIELQEEENAKILFNTTSSILAVKFGLCTTLAGGHDIEVKPMFMSVTTIHGEQPSTDLNSPKAASYKGRIFFIGNLELGHAWFSISNVTRNDTNKYALGIRTEKDKDYVIYAFNMTVVKRTGILVKSYIKYSQCHYNHYR